MTTFRATTCPPLLSCGTAQKRSEVMNAIARQKFIKEICGRIIDVRHRRIFKGRIKIKDQRISSITEAENESVPDDQYILPGLIDSHVHVESSMVVPSEFARMAVVHGTVGTVSDPHEIGNVIGIKGVEYMIDNGKQVNFKFYFGAPSSVPATQFETAGAEIDPIGVEFLLKKPEIVYLSEVMNWPGVLHNDPIVYAKLDAAKRLGLPIDGHAPGLRGKQAEKYINAGISTDHECFTYEEAEHKLKHGMKILIREGSAAKNFEALIPLLSDYPSRMMFCSDDKHPDDLVDGHINLLVKRALARGHDLFDVLQAACINPVDHYGMDIGTLNVGDPADFIVVNDPEDFVVKATYINGEQVSDGLQSLIPQVSNAVVNNFDCEPILQDQIKIHARSDSMHVIEAVDGQLFTHCLTEPVKRDADGYVVSDTDRDNVKIVVINRYDKTAQPAVAFIRNFNLKKGAIASSIAHDSHNIIAVGADDGSIVRAANLIIEAKGGVCAVSEEEELVIELPVAGIMSPSDGYEVARTYSKLDAMTKQSLGCRLASPFVTLSFMGLLVIPSLKLSDLGLFDADNFEFKNLFAP